MPNEAVMYAGAGAPPEPGLNQIERVVDTFVAPSKTFRDILRSAACWLPILLLVISSLATALVVDKKVGFDRVYENQVHMSPKTEDRMSNMEPAAKTQAMRIGTAITKYSTYLAWLLILIFMAIYALILWASFNFGLGAQTTFPQVFAVSIYAALPYLITSLLTIIMLYAGSNADAYDYKNPVGTNLAYFLPDAAPWLRGLLTSFDIVKLWSVVLTVIGMAIVAKKTIMQSAVVVGIFWVIGALLGTVGALFS